MTTTIAEMNRTVGPYSKRLRVKVIALTEPVRFMRGTENKISVKVGLADETGAIQLMCYKEKLIPLFTVGASLLIRGYRKRTETQLILDDGQSGEVYRTTNVKTTPQHEKAANILISPPSQEMELKDALNASAGTLVSVQGKVVKDEQAKEVTIAKTGGTALVRNIEITSTIGTTAKVALWRSLAETHVKIGDYISTSHMTTNEYMGEKRLQTSGFTKITFPEMPEYDIDVEIIGIQCNDTEYTLLADNDSEYKISADMMMTLLSIHIDDPSVASNLEAVFMQLLPVKLSLHLQDDNVTTARIIYLDQNE